MIKLSVAQIAEAVGGRLFCTEPEMRRVCEGLTWDSRTMEPGIIFLAMPGERVDGNDFIVSAVQKQAGCVICTREPDDALKAVAGEFACPLICVADGQEALQRLAGFWRRKLHAVVIGVTGSTGKTSTKDFLRAVLSQRFKTVATLANRNNEIGVPATILSADEDTEVLIVELGMRGKGQIDALCAFAMPSIGVVTNIGVSHMELLGSQEAIAEAKSELLQNLPVTGLAVLNADDVLTPYLSRCGLVAEHGLKVLSYGFSPQADVHAEEPSFDLEACAQFEMQVVGQPAVQVKLPLPGRHNVSNALAAAAVGKYLGLSSAEIAQGLESAHGSGMRMEVVRTHAGVTVVNDAYNANPDSMRASLATVAEMDCTGRRIAVLGDMGELGSSEQQLHEQVGRFAADSSLDLLICVGNLGRSIAAGARVAGMEEGKVKHFPDVASACSFLADSLSSGDLVLVKASRFMGLERIVEEIVG